MQVTDVRPTTLAEVLTHLKAVVSVEDPALLDGELAAKRVQLYAEIEKVAAAGRTLCAPRVAATRAWEGQGHQTCSDWMAAQAGTSVSDASRVLETGKRLHDLPATAAALRDGQLSPEQADIVSDAAIADPSAERRLLGTAQRETFKNLKEEGQKTKAAASDSARRRERIHTKRSVRNWIDGEGAAHLHLCGHPSDVARILVQVKPHQEAEFRAARSSHVRESYENRAYDAFMAMIGRLETGQTGARAGESTRATGDGAPTTDMGTAPPAPGTSDGHDQRGRPTGEPASLFEFDPAGDASTSEAPAGSGPPAGPDPPPPRRTGDTKLPGGNNVKIIVHVPWETLRRGHAVRGETCEIDGLGPVDLDDVHALWAGAFIAAVAEHGHDVTVAHLGRGLNAHQRTAVEAKKICCSNIACNGTVGIQVDHRHPWAKRQVTQLHNQDCLCPDCHRLKTYDGWRLEPGTGRRRFLPPAQASAPGPIGARGPDLSDSRGSG